MRNILNLDLSCIFILFFSFFFGCIANDEEELLSLLGLQLENEYKQPDILLFLPLRGEREVSKDRRLIFEFSKKMQRNLTESGISMSASGGNTEYTPIWENDYRLLLQFPAGMTEGKRYEVNLNRNSIKDTDGNRLVKNFLSDFYTEGGGRQTTVISSDPPADEAITVGWPIDRNIIIRFNEPMDKISTNSAVSISGGPAVYLPIWNESADELTLQLQSNLEIGTTYRLIVTTSAKSQAGINLTNDYLLNFNTASSFDRPVVSPNVTLGDNWSSLNPSPAVNTFNGVSKFDQFRFSFNIPMNRESVLNAISFNPPISGQYEWLSDTLLQFTPSSSLEIGNTYRLRISSSATSSQGQTLFNSYVVDFTVDDNFTSIPMELLGINGRTFDASCVISGAIDLNIAGLPNKNTVNTINPQTGCPQEYEFEVALNTAGGVPLKTFGEGDVFSASNININYLSGGPINSSLRIDQINYIPTANPQRLRIRITGVASNQVRYTFLLRGGPGGILDSNENYLEDDIEFIFFGN